VILTEDIYFILREEGIINGQSEYVCMYAYMHIRMYVRIHVHRYACMQVQSSGIYHVDENNVNQWYSTRSTYISGVTQDMLRGRKIKKIKQAHSSH
jgi:hypothetical protein